MTNIKGIRHIVNHKQLLTFDYQYCVSSIRIILDAILFKQMQVSAAYMHHVYQMGFRHSHKVDMMYPCKAGEVLGGSSLVNHIC